MKECEPLTREDTDAALEDMRWKISGVFGVTLQEDHNGAWGDAGARYLTLRWGEPMIEVTMRVITVRNTEADRHAQYERENPQ